MISERSSGKISIWTTAALCLFLSWSALSSPPKNILSYDIFGYYLFLPAKFIHEDWKMKDNSWAENSIELYKSSGTFYQATKHKNGNWVIMYTMGMGVMYSPFFWAGHVAAKLGDYPQDGFSIPYQKSVWLGSLFYSLLAIFFLRKILKKFFSDIMSAFLLLLVVLGTNYFHMAAYSGGMPHNYLFTLYAVLIWLCIRWHEDHKFHHAAIMGFICGLAVIVRPTELLCLLIPTLWGVTGLKTAKEKLILFWKKRWHILAFGFFFLLMLFQQMRYFKDVTGEWIYNSYANADDNFDFGNPHLTEVLFGFRKGWFVYTPLMLLAVAGIYFAWKNKKEIALPATLFIVVNTYILSSWSCWWYSQSFGHRAFVQTYPIMVILLGFFLSGVRKRFLQKGFFGLASIFLLLNQFQTWQYNQNIINGSRMTRDYYWRVFLKAKINPGDEKMLLIERPTTSIEIFSDPDGDYSAKTLATLNFSDKINDKETPPSGDSIFYSPPRALKIDSNFIFSPAFTRSFSKLTSKDHAWIKTSCWIYPTASVEKNKFCIVSEFINKGKSYKYRASVPEKYFSLKTNSWNKISFDYLTPETKSETDSLKTYFWLWGKMPVYVDDFMVESFERKN